MQIAEVLTISKLLSKFHEAEEAFTSFQHPLRAYSGFPYADRIYNL